MITLDEDCDSCWPVPEDPSDPCPNSQRPCGHHCNHAWAHDHCDWCNKRWSEDGTTVVNQCPGWIVTPEEMAEYFEAEYERIHDDRPWGTPELLAAVCTSVMRKFFREHLAIP